MSPACSPELKSPRPIAVGIDIVAIKKICPLISYGVDRLKRIYTAEELAAGGAPEHLSPRYLAAVFAIKEAVFKALGRGWGQGMRWNEVSAERGANGGWTAILSGAAGARLEKIGGTDISLCVSSGKDHVVAQAMISGKL